MPTYTFGSCKAAVQLSSDILKLLPRLKRKFSRFYTAYCTGLNDISLVPREVTRNQCLSMYYEYSLRRFKDNYAYDFMNAGISPSLVYNVMYARYRRAILDGNVNEKVMALAEAKQKRDRESQCYGPS